VSIPEQWSVKGVGKEYHSKTEVVDMFLKGLKQYGISPQAVTLEHEKVFLEKSGKYKDTYTAKPQVQPHSAAFNVLLDLQPGRDQADDLVWKSVHIVAPVPKALVKDYVLKVQVQLEDQGQYEAAADLRERVELCMKDWANQLHADYAAHLSQQPQPPALQQHLQHVTELNRQRLEAEKAEWEAQYKQQQAANAVEGPGAMETAWEQRVQTSQQQLTAAACQQYYQNAAMDHPMLVLMEGTVQHGFRKGEVKLELRHPDHVQLLEKAEAVTLLNPGTRSKIVLEPLVVDCRPVLSFSVITSVFPDRSALTNRQHMLTLTQLLINRAEAAAEAMIGLPQFRVKGAYQGPRFISLLNGTVLG
jgi:hypothetical protein